MNKRLIILFIFLFSLSLRLWNINEMGRTWDEAEYTEQGYRMVELLKKGDFNNSYFYTTYDHPPLVKYLYGIAAHFDVEKYLSNGEVILKYDLTYSRILSAILFSLGVSIVVLIGWKIFSQTVGNFSWKKVLISGIITGVALQAKQSNFLLIPMLGLIFFIQYFKLKTKEKIIFAKTRIKAIIAISLIGLCVFVLIWPQILFHFKEVYAIHNDTWSVRFSPKIWQITLSPPEIFFGRLMLAPIFYYIIYFFITIPVLILFLFFAGVRQVFEKKSIYLFSILLWFLLPFSLSIYSWRQHGLRYIIEIYPALAIISAIGFETLTKKLARGQLYRFLLFLPIVAYLFISLWFIKPYYLDYFNELVGGVNTVYRYNFFQTGWWGQGLKEAGLYLKNKAAVGSKIGLAISPKHTMPRLDGLDYSDWSVDKKYDYVVVNNYHIIRDGFSAAEIKKKKKK